MRHRKIRKIGSIRKIRLVIGLGGEMAKARWPRGGGPSPTELRFTLDTCFHAGFGKNSGKNSMKWLWSKHQKCVWQGLKSTCLAVSLDRFQVSRLGDLQCLLGVFIAL